MARQRGRDGSPGNADPDSGDMVRDAREAMARAEASLRRIGEALGDAAGQSDRAIQEALEAQQRAVLEASRAQEQAVAAAEQAVIRAIAATRITPRKR
jgi:hypothetical protein